MGFLRQINDPFDFCFVAFHSSRSHSAFKHTDCRHITFFWFIFAYRVEARGRARTYNGSRGNRTKGP